MFCLRKKKNESKNLNKSYGKSLEKRLVFQRVTVNQVSNKRKGECESKKERCRKCNSQVCIVIQ